MLRKAALVFGVVLTLVGLLGFVPGITTNDMLLGIFMVGALHNIIHLASGVLALVASKSAAYAQKYFQVFGVVYALVTVLGLVMNPILGILPVNAADNILHLAIAASSLYLGFGVRKDVEHV